MSSLVEHVSLQIQADTIGVARAGFGVALILSHSAGWIERTRSYTSLLDVATDFATTTPEYKAARALFSQSPHPERVMIGRAANSPTLAYQVNVTAAAANTRYSIQVEGDGVTSTECVYTSAADLAIESVANATETFTVTAHGMTTGDGPYRLKNAGGALPAGTAVDTDYWIIVLTADTFQLAATKADALSSTEILITTDGTGTHTLVRAQNDVICAQLVQALNAVVGNNYIAAQVTGAGETDYITVTADAAGEWFSLEINNAAYLTIKTTHSDPGVEADLTAIALEDSTWYALLTLFNSEAYVLAAAAWIETQSKIYLVDVSETEAITTVVGSGSDTLKELFALSYNRTAGAYHPNPNAFFSAAWAGRCLPLEPGSETWKYKTLAGVEAVTLTSTHRTNLRARKANTYETIAGVNVTWEGTLAGGTYGFIDVTRGLDWLHDDMTKSVFESFINDEKIPFTDPGIAVIRSQVKASLKRASDKGIITSDFTISVPKAADVSTADKALRTLPDVKFSATLQGAIHKVEILGVVSL